jgi:hypothetical protein
MISESRGISGRKAPEASHDRILETVAPRAMEAASPLRGGPTDAWNPDSVDSRDSTIPADYQDRTPPLNRKESRQVDAAIDQARKAVEGFGYSLRSLDSAHADGSRKIGRMDRKGNSAHFDTDGGRILIAPSFNDAATGPKEKEARHFESAFGTQNVTARPSGMVISIFAPGAMVPVTRLTSFVPSSSTP